MRIDEHGRWVSDDGSYVWDEAAQTWQLSAAYPTESTITGSDTGSGDAGVTGGTAIGGDAAVTTTGEFAPGYLALDTSGWSVLDGTLSPGAAHLESGPGPVRDGTPQSTQTVVDLPQPGGLDSWLLPGDDISSQGADILANTGGLDIAAAHGAAWQSYPLGPADPGTGPVTAVGTVVAPSTGEIAPSGASVRGLSEPFGVVDVIALGPARDGALPGTDTGAIALGSHPRASTGAHRQHRKRRAGGRASTPRPEADGDSAVPGPDRPLTRRLSSVAALPRRVLIAAAVVVLLLVGVGGYLALGGDDGDAVTNAPVNTVEGASPDTVAARPAQYSEALRADYLRECMQVSHGLQAYCTCTLEKLEANYPQDQYEQFNKSVNSPETTRIVQEISDQCVSV
ncbi:MULTISPECIES: hypothetical protein [Protofrankia]|uniref:Uncharacterized protein n=1 Tax=Candidatus Protofrankia datiscae TaxID=2716812 RepID=F8AUX9_9ACTN|nr:MULTISPECIES: hypothetical protein [Protofrankia]AEH11182.1 hypothetical protein FsymDg_3907 [Candidatus Protofrankia datiscae]